MTTPFEVPDALRQVIAGNQRDFEYTGPRTTPPENKTPSPSAVADPTTGLTPVQQSAKDLSTGVTEPVYDGPLAPGAPMPTEQAAQEQADRERRDSARRLNEVLNEYGLGELSSQVWDWIVEGLSEPEIVQRMRATDQYKTRFVGMEERRKKGLRAISETEYLNYERDARQLMRAAGLPEGFYDSSEDFTKFLVNDLSISELSDRVTLAANAAFRMPKEDRDALTAWGMGPGDLTAFWLDPDKAQPLLERKYAAAQLAGTSQRTGFGTLSENTATNLATMGVTAQQAEQGFGELAASREIFTPIELGEDAFGQQEQLDAAFGGNANARRRIENQRRRRQARFEGGGTFAASQGGLSGLGDSDS